MATSSGEVAKALRRDSSEFFRRYFVNTIFDSTFVVLGILAAVSAEPNPNVDFAIGTMFAASLAIGISTGVSVYEAERAEGQIRLQRLERAMLVRLGETQISREMRAAGLAVSVVNFFVPLVVALVTVIPLYLFRAGILGEFLTAAALAGALGLGIIFGSGYLLGRIAGRNPWRKAIRMTLVALLTFAILLVLERSI